MTTTFRRRPIIGSWLVAAAWLLAGLGAWVWLAILPGVGLLYLLGWLR